jgi:hypothetical protein
MAHDEENMNKSENITQDKKNISNSNYQNGERTNEKNGPEVREDEIKIASACPLFVCSCI